MKQTDSPAGGHCVRLVNTDNGLLRAWVSGSDFQIVAVDGTDVVGPTELRDECCENS